MADLQNDIGDAEVPLSEILDQAQKRVKAKGSTTSTMAYLKGDGHLETCNLGDSGYLLIRPDAHGKLTSLYRSESQQYYFNCPYQTGNHNKKSPSHEAFSICHLVKENDIIVLGTDGVWDNLYDQDIMKIVE